MAFEIEMIAVGAADAILVRYFGENDKEIVILIDAGYKKDGKKIADHINKWTDSKRIHLAICTHPDNDHIGGFFYLVDHVPIDLFWIHDPKKHVPAIQGLEALKESATEDSQLEKSLSHVFENLKHSKSLLSQLDAKGIKRQEPFAGLKYKHAPLTVLGPEKGYYTSLLAKFRDASILLEDSDYFEKAEITEAFNQLLKTDEAKLDDEDDKSPENNSSVIMLFEPENKKYLFTSDVGPEALEPVVRQYKLRNIDWLDVPHHGSKCNFSTHLIKTLNPKLAYISCDGSAHWPSLALVNLLKANGAIVYSTQDGNKLHRRGTNSRVGYSPAKPL